MDGGDEGEDGLHILLNNIERRTICFTISKTKAECKIAQKKEW
jgi:hypothetical protein